MFTREFIKKVSKTFFVLACCLILVSCFEEGSKTSGKKDVTEILENRESQATNYARSIQQYSALVMQNLMEEARANDMQLQDLWTSGAGSIAETGLVDISGFANMNAGRMNNQLSAAYCNGAVFTWIQGEGGHQAKLKGLGESGSEAIGRVLSKQLGSNGYGIYKDGMIETASGGSVNVGCAAAELIPEGTPVIFNAVAAMDLSRSGTHYEFFNENCPSGEGFIRYRRQVSVEYDTYGEELSREEGEQEVFINACMEDVSTVDIAVTNMPTVSVVDFAAQSGGGDNMTATKEVICFEAEMEDGEGGQQQGGSGGDYQQPAGSSSMTNCYNPGTFETSMPQGVTFTCGVQPNTTETQMMACQGSGWTGDVTYEREVEYCRIDGGPDDGNIFEKRKPWERTAVDCQRNETQSVSCPFGAGLVIYSRINTITNPVTLAPNNPDWNYTSDSCATDETSSCIGAYAGNRVAFNRTTSGNNNPPNATTGSMAQYCGSGSLCTIERTISCPPNRDGNRVQRRNYLCGSGWSAWADRDPDACCLRTINFGTGDLNFTGPGGTNWQHNIECNRCDGGVDRITTSANNPALNPDNSSYGFGRIAPGACRSDYVTGGFDAGGTYRVQLHACVNAAGNQVTFRHRRTDISPNPWVDHGTATCGFDAGTCRHDGLDYVAGESVSRNASCPSGHAGTRIQGRTCQSGGNWSGWSDTTNTCAPVICTPGATDTDTQVCDSGYTGDKTRTRTCNSSGTAWSGWSGWNMSGCTPSGGGSCSWVRGQQINVSDGQIDSYPSCPSEGSSCASGTSNIDCAAGLVYEFECDCPPAQVCTPNATDTDTQACDAGYTGNKTRTRTCNGSGSAWGSWTGWDTSSCVPQICTPGSVDTDIQSCGSGFNGNQYNRRTCNSSGTAYGSWSGWDRSSCVAQSCSPGYVDTETTECGAGYSGNQHRSRTCNNDGTGYGPFGGWNRTGCVVEAAGGSCDRWRGGYSGTAGAGRICSDRNRVYSELNSRSFETSDRESPTTLWSGWFNLNSDNVIDRCTNFCESNNAECCEIWAEATITSVGGGGGGRTSASTTRAYNCFAFGAPMNEVKTLSGSAPTSNPGGTTFRPWRLATECADGDTPSGPTITGPSLGGCSDGGTLLETRSPWPMDPTYVDDARCDCGAVWGGIYGGNYQCSSTNMGP